MELRRFTDAGLQAFEVFLDSCNTDKSQPYPENILTGPLHSELVEPTVQIESKTFATRFELAKQIDDGFTAANFTPRQGDTGLWAWVACFHFLQICPKDRSGKWKPGSMERWIPRSNDFRRYYRHLVAGPYWIYRAYHDDPRCAMVVLCQKPGSPGDVVEQLASRQWIITNPSIMQVASDLYVDPETGKQRKGAQSKKAGGVLRYKAVLDQLDVTWDLSMLSVSGLHELLPDEFNE